MALSERLAIIITANGSAAVSEFKKVERSATRDLGKADTAAAKFKANWTRIAAGMAVVGAAVAAGLRVAVDEASEAAVVGRQTDAVIRSTGGAANVTKGHLEDLAGSLSKVAAVDDEVIQSAGNVLLTFKAVRNEVGQGNDIFDRATAAALDMSAALGGDLQGATLQLGKALSNPVQGLTALRRAGVDFTAQQRDQIAAMVAVGDILGAQKLILAEVEAQFDGSAEAQATGLARLEVAWGNLMEKIGTPVNSWFEQLAQDIEDPMAKIEEWTRLTALGYGLWEAFEPPPDMIDGIGHVAGELPAALDATASAAERAGTAVEDLTDAIDMYLSGTFDLPAAQRDVGEAFATLSEAMTSSTPNWNEQAVAMEDVVKETATMISIMSEQGASQQAVDDKVRGSIRTLRQMRDDGRLTGDQFVTLRDQILAIPHGTETRVQTPGARAAREEMRELKRDIEIVPGRKSVYANVVVERRAFDQLVRDLDAADNRRFSMQVSVNNSSVESAAGRQVEAGQLVPAGQTRSTLAGAGRAADTASPAGGVVNNYFVISEAEMMRMVPPDQRASIRRRVLAGAR